MNKRGMIMKYYSAACLMASKRSREYKGTEWAVVYNKARGEFIVSRKHDPGSVLEEWSVYKNGVEVYRKKEK